MSDGYVFYGYSVGAEHMLNSNERHIGALTLGQ